MLALAGCYAYVAPRTASTPSASIVGRSAEVTLTDSGAVVLAPRIGRAVEHIRGNVVSDNPSAIGLAVEQTIDRDGVETTWKHERVEIPHSLSRAVTVRQFSPSRTILFSGILSIALFAIEQGFRGGGANAPGPSPRNGPPPAVVSPGSPVGS